MTGHEHKEAVTAMPKVKTPMRFNYVSKVWKKNFSFYDHFSRSLQQFNGNTPIGFICCNKTDNYAAKRVFCVENKFLYMLEKHFFGGAKKFIYCPSKEIGQMFHMHQLYYGCIVAYDSDDPNGHVLLIQVPSTWGDILYANTMRQSEGMKYGPLQFINIKDMVIKDTWIKTIQMTTLPKRSIRTTGVHKETMDTLAVSGYMDEFLSRLPVKTLNCVSKDWNDFIFNDYSRRRYRSLQQVNVNTPTAFFGGNQNDLPIINLVHFAPLGFEREERRSSVCVKNPNEEVSIYKVKLYSSETQTCQQFSSKKSGYMDLLPSEVIQEELLMRLPVKTLMRLNCVSKDWNDFISDGLFRRRYQSLQQANGNTPIGFICGYETDDNEEADHGFCMANKFLYTSENYVEKEELGCFDHLKAFGYVIAASKGLLLVGHNLNRLSAYDLVSKKHVKLPRNNLEGGDLGSLGFKCEESSSSNHHLCYKVVCVDNPGMDKYQRRFSHNVEIYSSETGVWKKSIMKSKLLPFQILSRLIAKVIRGVFFWHEENYNSFIAYDCEDPKDSVVLIALPNIKNITDRENVRQLEGMEDGSLQFVSRDNDESILKVWILQCKSGSYMDEDMVVADRWVLAYSISLCDIGVGFSGLRDTFKILTRIIGVDPVDPHIIYLCIIEQIYAYNYRKGKVVIFLSPKIELVTDVFVHFEWPTWPCL